ncbi:MAG: CehA/McbA family metallohydrolase [Planctomycetes bacterium]|nr:CehA/McbA family metallohydrolase [Planctomycetota bacterium]
MSGTQTVHLRVNDSATGRPTAVRLRVVGPGGEYIAPLGRVVDFPTGRNEEVSDHAYLGGQKFCFIDGSCEVILPTGVPLEIELSKGIEYEPVRQTVTLNPGQMALRLTISRWFDRHSEGWLSADTRCHFLTPHSALLEAAAEDLDFVHLLATETEYPSNDGHLYRMIPNMPAFSGQCPALEKDGRAVVVNTFNKHPALGRLGLLNSHRPVHPLSFGGDEQTDDWSLCDWCNQCHRKGGLTVWADAFRMEMGIPGGESLVAAILGKIDAFEIDAGERATPLLPHWYQLLNAGIRLPLVGCSGKDSNRSVLGAMRLYTQTEPDKITLADWVERTRQGRTFVSNGPLLELTVNGNGSGETVHLGEVEVQAKARSLNPHDRLEIIINGSVVAEASPSGTPYESCIETNLKIPDGGWLAARCVGSAKSAIYPMLATFAHTSPVWIEIEGRPTRAVPAAVRSLMGLLKNVREWIETQGHFALPKRQAQMLERCDEATQILESR